MMRLASFSVENLFDRALAMNLETWEEGRAVLDRYARINRLLNRATYTGPTRRRSRRCSSISA